MRAQLRDQRADVGCGAVTHHDVRDQLFADARQVGRGHHGVLDGSVRHHCDLDLARLDAKAVDLQLLVGTAEVGAHAGCVAPHQVAGDVPALGQAFEVAAEALGGQFGPAEVAARQCVAAEQQLAGGVVGARFTWHGHDVDQRQPHVRQGQADRRDLWPGGRVAAQLVRGDHVAFGRAVVVVQFGTRQAHEHRADRRRDLQLFAGADDVAQSRRRTLAGGIGNHLQRHVGHEDALDAMFDQRGQQQCRVAPLCLGHQHQRAAAGQRREDLLEVHIERQRRELQDTSGLAQTGMLCVPLNQVTQRHRAHRHALGPAGRTRREQHIAQVWCCCVRHLARRGRLIERREVAHGRP